MKYLVHMVVLGGALAGAYFYFTAEVPGGEQRWEQWFRQTTDRGVGSFQSQSFGGFR